ncbi:hypothetical protein R3I93_017514 [Phoxinus phoxinus]|uniref:Uncharacterized protein n=1 Tax=Phoxinus phoxinus TaxID=58324 RepID=A0AAN9GZ11_9TELE
MRLSDAYEDSESETRALDALEKELNMREERLKEREKKVEIVSREQRRRMMRCCKKMRPLTMTYKQQRLHEHRLKLMRKK